MLNEKRNSPTRLRRVHLFFNSWATANWTARGCALPYQQAVTVQWIHIHAGSWQQLSKQPKAKHSNNFTLYLGRVIINTNRKKCSKKLHWVLMYHLDFDHESLLRILKDRKLNRRTTRVLDCNHGNFCTHYACLQQKGKIAEDYNLVRFQMRPRFKIFSYTIYPMYYIKPTTS